MTQHQNLKQEILDRLHDENELYDVVAALNSTHTAVDALLRSGRLQSDKKRFGGLTVSKAQVAAYLDTLDTDQHERIVNGPPALTSVAGSVAAIDQLSAGLRDASSRTIAPMVEYVAALVVQARSGDAKAAEVALPKVLLVYATDRMRQHTERSIALTNQLMAQAQASGVSQFSCSVPIDEALDGAVDSVAVQELTDRVDWAREAYDAIVSYRSAEEDRDPDRLREAVVELIDFCERDQLRS